MTVVYIDLLFLLNFTANYLLLLGTGRITGAILSRWRIALGAVAGALYAVLLFLPEMGWLDAWPFKLLSGILMPLIAFGGERALFRIIVIFFGVSAGLAGLVMAAELLGGAGLTIRNGVLYSQFDLRLLLLLFLICYFVMSFFFRRSGQHVTREMIALSIEINGRHLNLTALLDSGHTLTDPATNNPVVVADGQCFAWCLPKGVDLFRPVEGIKLCRESGLSHVRLIPYRAVGVDCGMLLALRAEMVCAGGRRMNGAFVALSPTPVDDGGGYQALIGDL